MAKFKVGNRITDGNAVYEITDVDDGVYEWKVISGKADPSHSEGGEIAWAEGKMRLANSAPVRSANAVVQNAINARRARNAGQGFDERFIQQKMQSVANDLEDLKDYIVRSLPDETVDPSSFRRLSSKYLSPIEAALRNL